MPDAERLRKMGFAGRLRLSTLKIVLVNRGMEQISRRIIFNTLPDARRTKPLKDAVLG